MSKCISNLGEYSDHVLGETFLCERCFQYDEDGATAHIKKLEDQLNALLDPTTVQLIDAWAEHQKDKPKMPVDDEQLPDYKIRQMNFWQQTEDAWRKLAGTHLAANALRYAQRGKGKMKYR